MTELANEDVWLKGGLTWLVWGFWRGDIEEWGDINSGSGLFPKGLAGALGEAWPGGRLICLIILFWAIIVCCCCCWSRPICPEFPIWSGNWKWPPWLFVVIVPPENERWRFIRIGLDLGTLLLMGLCMAGCWACCCLMFHWFCCWLKWGDIWELGVEGPGRISWLRLGCCWCCIPENLGDMGPGIWFLCRVTLGTVPLFISSLKFSV